MARCAKYDPIEKFRFKLTVFDLDPTGITSVDSSQDKTITAGFTDIVTPRSRVNQIEYRENIDSNRTTKYPGIASYEPIVLRRGVIKEDRGLYNWYKKVVNDANALGAINELLAANNNMHILPVNFRKDLVIEALSRDGETYRAWFVFNAFPIEYKGGNDLSSNTEEKLIEELVLTYEAYVELNTGDIQKLIEESQEAAGDAIASAIASAAIGGGLGGLL